MFILIEKHQRFKKNDTFVRSRVILIIEVINLNSEQPSQKYFAF